MDLVFIISPVVGAIIGYCTNWLAIKMLFKPLTKKEILGIPIPFTPGVIPRRRGKLATSIGEAVGSRLLTADAFSKMLQGEEMREKIEQFITEKLDLLLSEERSLSELLNPIWNQSQEKRLEESLEELIPQLTARVLTKDRINDLLDRLLADFNQQQLAEYLASEDYQQLKADLLAKLDQKQVEEGIFIILESFSQELATSEEKLQDLLPDSVITQIKEWIASNEPELTQQISEFLTSESVKDRIDDKLDELLGSNPLASMFGGVKEGLVTKFLTYIVDFLEDPASRENIRQQLNQFVDSLLETKVAVIAQKVDEDDLSTMAAEIAKQLVEEGQAELVVAGLEQIIVDNLAVSDLESQVKKLSSKLVDSANITPKVNQFVLGQASDLLNRPVQDYLSWLAPSQIDKLKAKLVIIIEYLLEHHLGKVLATLDFEAMVKRKINSFDILEVERLLLDVIAKELEAITWFGAVLGFVMGLITPIISTLV
ncbi:DUF445 family protein [Halanaerobaculum tunisiense]